MVMMKNETIKQYDEFADSFSEFQFKGNQISREALYSQLPKSLKNKKVLDLGCGDGIDLKHLANLGGDVYGLDASKELLEKAKKALQNAKFINASFQNIPFEDDFFDLVYSKYAIQTVDDLDLVFQEVHRVLKVGGIFLFVAVHPLRQFIEKKRGGKDYYKREIVRSVLFGGTVIVQEPIHTLGEYFSNFIVRNFDIIYYNEVYDPAAEQIDGHIYPGFLLLKIIKLK
jgi:ubiquinone/menaquinone biosynthesis C-methylase UbiE